MEHCSADIFSYVDTVIIIIIIIIIFIHYHYFYHYPLSLYQLILGIWNVKSGVIEVPENFIVTTESKQGSQQLLFVNAGWVYDSYTADVGLRH